MGGGGGGGEEILCLYYNIVISFMHVQTKLDNDKIEVCVGGVWMGVTGGGGCGKDGREKE